MWVATAWEMGLCSGGGDQLRVAEGGARRRRMEGAWGLGLCRNAIEGEAEWGVSFTAARRALYRLGRGCGVTGMPLSYKGDGRELVPRLGGSGRVYGGV